MFQVGWKFTNALGMFFRKEESAITPPSLGDFLITEDDRGLLTESSNNILTEQYTPVANYLITQSGLYIVTLSGLNIKVT